MAGKKIWFCPSVQWCNAYVVRARRLQGTQARFGAYTNSSRFLFLNVKGFQGL